MKRMWKIPHLARKGGGHLKYFSVHLRTQTQSSNVIKFQYTRRCSWSCSPPTATLPPHCPRESPPCPPDTPTSSPDGSYERREPPTLSSSLVTGLRPLYRQRGALHQHPPQLQLDRQASLANSGPPGSMIVMGRLWKHNLYCIVTTINI